MTELGHCALALGREGQNANVLSAVFTETFTLNYVNKNGRHRKIYLVKGWRKELPRRQKVTKPLA